MKITILKAGYCTHLEKVASRQGKWKNVPFPALFALLEHPDQGYILFDTGYSNHVHKSMETFPCSIYGKLTPIYFEKGESAKEQLKAMGISSGDIKTIILSHFHADHIGGCLDFPMARFLCSQKDYTHLQNKTGFSALRNAFIPSLLPEDFKERVEFVEDRPSIPFPWANAPFTRAYDLFGDQRILAVELPGHTGGQFGLYAIGDEGPVFFISDACWLTETYTNLSLPNPLASLIMDNWGQYIETIHKIHGLHRLYPEVKIVPTHAMDTFKEKEK